MPHRTFDINATPLFDDIVATTKSIMARYKDKTGFILNTLNDVQEAYRFLPEEALQSIAEATEVPLNDLKNMGEFFDILSLVPTGRRVIEVCDGTCCHLQGAPRLIESFEKLLEIKAGEVTKDGLFSLKAVNCIGACGLAPVVTSEDLVFGRMKVTGVAGITVTLRAVGEEQESQATSVVPAANVEPEASEGLLGETENLDRSNQTTHKSPWAHATGNTNPVIPRVTVGLATCGKAAGGQVVFDELAKQLPGFEIDLVAVGCRGLCYAEPLVEVSLPSGPSWLLGSMDQTSTQVLAGILKQGNLAVAMSSLADHILSKACLEAQERRVLSNCGVVNPHSIEEYLAQGGYSALRKALTELTPKEVINEVLDAGLRGRGGAGFSTGRKLTACASNNARERYFIVNGDEGDPGAYMDRALLESDPHRVLEGLIISCFAIGAQQAYIFIRAEYSLAVATVHTAVSAARQAGFIGQDILGSGFSLEVSILRGAGAFLCGESTALVNVLENKPCVPRKRPPHLAEVGLWGKPTCMNNVETLANVPLIIEHSAHWFRSVGTEKSPGTKIFSVVGSIAQSGLIEVPMGTPISKITEDIALAQNPKAAQIGGPSGVILPLSLFDLEVSFEGLDAVGAMMGSGGLVVISETQCVIDTTYYLLNFSLHQSCKQCKVCREGLEECTEILKSFTLGQANREDTVRLYEWAELCREKSRCGLGRTALNPMTSSLRYFSDEYEAHLNQYCPSLVCQALISYEIDQSRCQGERCCLLSCPGNAIKGRYGRPGHIVPRLCQKCGLCKTTCPYSAVRKVSPAVQLPV